MISDTIQTKISDLQKQARDVMESIDTTAQRIEDLLQEDKELVSGVQQVIASLTDRLGKTVEEGVVEHITRTVGGVRFIEGVGKEKYNGRIGGYDGKWELTQTILKANKINTPIIVGLINDSLIINSWHTKHTYTFNLIDEETKEILRSNGDSFVWSCALLDEETILCGMRHESHLGENMDDAIRLYDRQWNMIKSISLPHTTNHSTSCVDVAVGKNGMIIAAEASQPNIYILNPANGLIIKTITCECDVALCGVLTSGEILCHKLTLNTSLLIVNGNGNQTETTFPGKVIDITVDSLTEDIYVILTTRKQEEYVINRMSDRGDKKKKKRVDIFTQK